MMYSPHVLAVPRRFCWL